MGEWKALKKASGTGLKELEREAGTGWRALEWQTNIDVGSPAISRAYTLLTGYTSVTKVNPVNANGKIDKVDLYVGSAGSFIVAIYEDKGSNQLKVKDNHDCGNLGVGLHSNIAVDLDVIAGEYIGVYSSGGGIDYNYPEGSDRWYKVANYTTIGQTYTFTYSAVNVMYSMFGSNY